MGIASGLQMTGNQQISYCVILYERSISSPTYSQLRRIRHAVSLQLTLLASRHPCHCRQCRCSCTTGGKTSSSALQLLLPAKPSPEKELAEIPLSHTSNLSPGLYLNEHRRETEGFMTPVNWGIGFSKLEGECQKIRLQMSTHVFSLCGGSPGVQAL